MTTKAALVTSGTGGHSRGARWFRRGAAAVTNLLFPPRCTCCGAECTARDGAPLLCPNCDAELAVSSRPTCPRCALSCSEAELAGGDCWSCRGRKLLFRQARTIGPYQGLLREAVLKIKHAAYEPLAVAAGLRLAEALRGQPLPRQPDFVTAVPMHWLKRLWRGTNTAETVARALTRQLDLKLAAGLLICQRYLRRQASLTPPERRRNVHGAFRASRRWNIQGHTILLVDDVMTTGATAGEAARALRQAGAVDVFVATVARASPNF